MEMNIARGSNDINWQKEKYGVSLFKRLFIRSKGIVDEIKI